MDFPILQSISLRRDPYYVSEVRTATPSSSPQESFHEYQLGVTSEIATPAIDGFYCALLEVPENSIVGRILEADSYGWWFLSSIQQISFQNINVESTMVWRGFNDTAYHMPTRAVYDSSVELILVDDEYSRVLNLLTVWHYSLPQYRQFPRALYRVDRDRSTAYYGVGTVNPDLKTVASSPVFKTNLLVLVFTPSIHLTYAILLVGVYPSTVPLSSMVLDVSSYDTRKLSTTFNYDRIIIGSPVLEVLRKKHDNLVQSVVTILRQAKPSEVESEY